MNAESTLAFRSFFLPLVASMRPRSYKRGKLEGVVAVKQDSMASMRPRSYKRGKLWDE